MSQAYDRYLEAKAAYELANAKVETQLQQMRSFLTPLLFNAKAFYVDAGVPVPTAMRLRRVRVNGEGIPTPIDVGASLIAQFEALRTAQDAWDGIPETERKDLREPSWLQSVRQDVMRHQPAA
jgi:hypothetical protein